MHPINPLSLKIQSISHLLTTEEGREEVSSLALCAYGFISMCKSTCIGGLPYLLLTPIHPSQQATCSETWPCRRSTITR